MYDDFDKSSVTFADVDIINFSFCKTFKYFTIWCLMTLFHVNDVNLFRKQRWLTHWQLHESKRINKLYANYEYKHLFFESILTQLRSFPLPVRPTNYCNHVHVLKTHVIVLLNGSRVWFLLLCFIYLIFCFGIWEKFDSKIYESLLKNDLTTTFLSTIVNYSITKNQNFTAEILFILSPHVNLIQTNWFRKEFHLLIPH